MTTDHRAAPGDTLDDRYVLKQIIGQGGMGQVFWGEQINLGRKVAIKILRTRAEDRSEEYEARFRREALAASRLAHPNIVQIVDYGQDPDLGMYLVMEFLIGRNLAEIIDDGPAPSPHRIADILAQTLAALEAAHGSKILHRDIKPANIMACDVPGRPDFVKVLDFGIARALDGGLGDLKLTRAGTVCGTPAYMAPEQATGKTLDGRADLYAVGTILYEMLTGHLPFDETNPMDYLLRKVQEDAPLPDVMASGGDVPLELAAICSRGIARHPDHRYADAATFRKALEGWLRDAGDAPHRPRGEATATGTPAPAVPAASPAAGGEHKLEADTWAVLRQQDDGDAPELLAPTPPQASAAAAPPAPAEPYPRLGQRVVGREALLDELADALDQAEAQGWSGWVLYGHRGSGRSRLLSAAAARAGAAGWELFVVRPTATGLSPYLVPGDLLMPPRDEGPRLVVVDDLDLFPETVQEAFLTPTYFQDRPTLVLGAAVARSGAQTGARSRELPPLTTAERAQLTAECLGDAPPPDGPQRDFPAWLQHRLHLDVERGRLVPDAAGVWHYPDGPPWTGRMGSSTETATLVRDRVRDLPPLLQRLLRLLALAPAGLERDGLSRLDTGDESVDDLLERLLQAQLVEVRGVLWSIGSRTLAESLRAEIRPREQGRLSVELADLCAHAARYARGARRRQLHLQEAVLREAAGQRNQAAQRLRDVAELMRWIEQPERAIAPLRHALALSHGEVEWTTREIRLATDLATALSAAGNPKAAWELLEQIEVRQRLSPEYPARVALGRARALAVENLPAATEAFELATRLAGEAQDSFLEIAVRLAHAGLLIRRRDRANAARQVEGAQATLQLGDLPPHHAAEVELRLARALARTGDKDRARQGYRRVIDEAERQGLDHAVARAHLGLASLLIERGDPKGAGRHIDAVRSDRDLEPVIKARAALNRGLLATILRDPEMAQACHREALGWSCAAGWAGGIRQAKQSLERG